MLTILLHSSKTMRATVHAATYQAPQLVSHAQILATYVRSLSTEQLAAAMHLSPDMAVRTRDLWRSWNSEPAQQVPAIDAFIGDIYSGVQVQSFGAADRAYANEHLLILSGLYGGLRALDSIMPYRLEMGYTLAPKPYRNLYEFWGDQIARLIPPSNTIINLSAVEYTKAVLPHLPDAAVSTPKFMTMNAQGVPVFVTVHAKVARGAFARWLIANRIDSVSGLTNFTDLNYRFEPKLSTPEQPVFVCETYGGLGLSIRLQK